MKMIKVLILVELTMIFTQCVIGLIMKNSEMVLIAPFSVVLMLTVMFYAFNWKEKGIFKFLTGNFVLRGEHSDENTCIYGERFSKWVEIVSKYIGLIPLIVIFLYVNFTSGETLLIISLSLISVGIAVSILTFEYSQSVKSKLEKSMVYDGARRFYLATIFSIFFMIFVVVLKFLTPYTPNMMDFNLLNYLTSYLKGLGVGISIFLSILFLPLSVKYFIEGFIITIKGTVEFKN